MRVLIVEDELYLAEAIRDGLRLEAIAAELERTGKAESATTFRLLGERHKSRAERLAALLPPFATAEPGADQGEG